MGPGTVNLILLGVVVAGVLVAIALAIWSVRRPAPDGASTSLSTVEKVAVAVVGGGALIAVPLAVMTLVASAVSTFTSASVRIAGLAVGASGYPEFLQASDAPVDAGYETVWIEVANLPGGIRWLLWAETALPALLALGIAVALSWLAIALLRSAPFTRALPVVLGVVAIAVIASGLGTQVLGAIARAETVRFLGPPELITPHDDESGTSEGLLAFSATLDLSPLAWGMGIALVTAAFTIGARLQRDTRGLV